MEKENNIEFLTGQKTVTCSFTAMKYVNKAKKLYKKQPEDFEYFMENPDGSVCCKMDAKYLKLSAPRQMSDEQREASARRLAEVRKSK